MSTTKNVQMSEFNRTDYDILLPQTRLDFELGNEYMWAKLNVAAGYYEIQTLKDSIYVIDSETKAYTFRYSDSITIDEDGNLSLTNPLTFTATYKQFYNNYGTTLLGKYLDTTGLQKEVGIIFIPTNAIINYYNGRQVDIRKSYIISVGYDENRAIVGYVNSTSPDAYPPAVSDGYTYKPLGQLGDKVRSATGSYNGTGTYGMTNPNSLTFEFVPKVIFIGPGVLRTGGNSSSYEMRIIRGQYDAIAFMSNNSNASGYKNRLSFDGTQVKWWNTSSAPYQLNDGSYTYYYLAIG